MSEEEQQPAQQIVKHRRKKNEIEKDYICGDPSCGRKYGTNAALYTHIKNKHNGIPPPGTIKPSSSGKKNIIQRSNDSDSGEQKQGINREDEERKMIVETVSNPDFVKFTHMIGTLGMIEKNENLIVRNDSNFQQYGEEEIEKLIKDTNEVQIY